MLFGFFITDLSCNVVNFQSAVHVICGCFIYKVVVFI